MAAAAVIGFVIDAIRKIVSRRIASFSRTLILPNASTRISSPRAINVTMPGMSPRST
jgi:hypothetical protein